MTQPEEPGDAIVFTSISQAYADGVYDIDFDLMQTNGQHFKASYDGPIELDDYTSMGGGGYAR